MRAAYIIVFFLLVSGVSLSQSYTSKSKKAIKLYTEARTLMGNRAFNKAFDKLQSAIAKDPNFAEAYLKLATIYRIRIQDSLQMNCYKEVINRYPNASRFSNSWFYLGEYEFKAGEYQTSIDYLKKYLKLTAEKGKFLNKSRLMIGNSNFAIEYKINDFQFNPRPLPEIVNQFNQQYFPVLTADQKTLIYVKREANEEIMLSQLDSLGFWQNPVSISSNINSEFNEGTCSISADGSKLVFTSCMGRKGYGSCDLYISNKIGDEWSIPKNMGSNINSEAWDSQPSLSSDGRTLYFVSNRKGGFGKRDIYKSTLSKKSEWSKPINIGPDINSSFDDISPFIHPNGQRLYFSTNGRLGFGGFDIYFSEEKDNRWSKPINFGYPINTHNDEVSMYISSDGKKGFYSHEEKVKSSFTSTLYEIDIPPLLQVKNKSSYVYGVISDKKNNFPIAAKISLIDLDSEVSMEIAQSDSINGKYLIVLTEGKDYGLFVESNGYLYSSINFNVKEELIEPIEVNIGLEPIAVGAKIILNNIFFEFNSFKLTKASEVELSKILRLIEHNSLNRVEVIGYTDNIGGEKYNLELSRKRAKSVYEYLVNNGISKRILSYSGLGASNFLNSNNFEEDRSKNRRIEFKILEE